MATPLFGFYECNFNLGGIQRFFFNDGSQNIDYPLDLNFTNNQVDSINDTLDWFEITEPDSITFDEQFIEDRAGKYFQLSIDMVIPAISDNNNRFFNAQNIKNYLKRNVTVVFLDNNDNWYVTGYDTPFELSNWEINNEDNSYTVALINNTISRARLINPQWVEDNLLT